MFFPVLSKLSRTRRSPTGCPSPTCHRKALGSFCFKAARYVISGTSSALSRSSKTVAMIEVGLSGLDRSNKQRCSGSGFFRHS